MIPDAKDKVVRAVARVETIEVARLVETESSIIELIFAKKGHVPGHEVAQSNLHIQSKLGAGLRVPCLGVLQTGKENPRTNCKVWLEALSGVAKHQIDWS